MPTTTTKQNTNAVNVTNAPVNAGGASAAARTTNGLATQGSNGSIAPLSSASGSQVSSTTQTGNGSVTTPSTGTGTTGNGAYNTPSGYYETGRYVNVAPGGNAPAGTSIGDTVITAGGNYLVVDPNTPGASYNPTNGLWSIKVPSRATSGTVDANGNYIPMGTWMDQGLSESDKAKIESLQAAWDQANMRGDEALKQQLHAAAQAIREKYGYSGGGDGSMYLPIELPEGHLPNVGLPSVTLPSYEAQIDPTNDVYDAALDAAIAGLQNAYDQSRLEIEHAMSGIPQQYQDQRNAVAAQSERDRLRWNEYAAATGLGSGVNGQASLAFSTQLQNDLGSLRRGEADAIADMQLQLNQLEVSYQNSIAEAIANNEYERAAALLEEYRQQAQSVVDTAQLQAQLDTDRWLNQAYLDQDIADFNQNADQQNYQELLDRAETLAAFGNFSGYLALGSSQDQVEQMRKAWAAMNPNLAAYATA